MNLLLRNWPWLGLCVLLCAPCGGARADSAVSVADAKAAGAGFPVRPFTLLGGVGSGYGFVSGDDYAETPGGAHALFSLSVATQLPRWEFEGGVSWLYSNINGRNSANLPIGVRTRAGTADLGARYRLGERWQLGPQLDLAFGTDTSLGPDIGGAQAQLLIGVRALYGFPHAFGPLPLRFWGQVSTDTASGAHRLYVGLVGVQLGLPIGGHREAVAAIASQDSVRVSSASAQWAGDHEVRIVLDEEKVFFGTNSAALRPEVLSVLEAVGSYLANEGKRVGEVEIAGHADRRGRYQYNLKLSRKRADSVKSALAEGGAPEDHLKTEGFSYLVPLDPGTGKRAWAKNRRVELAFKDVEDPAKLRDLLKPLETAKPLENK